MIDVGAAYNAARNIFAIVESKDEHDLRKEENTVNGELVPLLDEKSVQNFKGDIEIKNLTFKYPSRDKYVIKNLNLKI